jgi:hypothetical protein
VVGSSTVEESRGGLLFLVVFYLLDDEGFSQRVLGPGGVLPTGMMDESHGGHLVWWHPTH